MTDIPAGRLLVVDDEERHMLALRDTLRDHGYTVTGVTLGEDALALLRPNEFDLLLTDLMMPKMNGIELLRAALKIDANLAGIVMTGFGTIDSAVEAMKAGALDYILKPFKLSIVLPVLARALTLRRLRLENADLEQRLRERSAALEAANKELESFTSTVSHDLQTPLRAISGFSGMLMTRYSAQLPSEGQHLLGRIGTNVRKMEQLITDLLRFSRMDSQPLTRQSINLAGLVREVAEELHQQEGNRHAEIVVADLPDCTGDPALLRQVFVNLLSNACKFTRGRERPRVEVGCEQREGERIYFVRDNGAGFDMREAARLFGVFQRLHSAESFEGTGIGLFTVRRIVERHAGRVWAEAEVDKGATFYCALPG